MKKRIFALIFAIIICLSSFTCAFAFDYYDEAPAVIDGAMLLSSSETEELDDSLTELSDEYDIDFAVATVFSYELGWTDITVYADNLYRNIYSNSEADGAVILVYAHGDEGDREICIVCYGDAEDEFSESKTSKIVDAVQSEIEDGNYAEAFELFAEKSEQILNPTISWIYLPVCLIIGFVIAFIIMKIIASANKSVRSKVNATEYVRANSLNISNSSEIYLYSKTSAVPKANTNTTSKTSGGGRATRSGKF